MTTKISVFNTSKTAATRRQDTNLFKQLLFLLLILNYAAAKTLFDVDDICECGSRCVGYGAKHCVRCCTTVMRRSVPLSEYPMAQLKEAATIQNVASTEEEKQQNDLIAQFVEEQERKISRENVENDGEQQKSSRRLEKRSDNFQMFIPSMLLDRAYLRAEKW